MGKTIKVIGVGSPILDLVAEINDDLLLKIPGEKGGMELIDSVSMKSILDLLENEPVKASGGSAGNTTFALARLGTACAFLGKLGDDENGAYYREAFQRMNGDCSRFKIDADLPTACCISLVTPDSERTMRTDLGAAMNLSSAEITTDDFRGCSHAHIEGYLLFNRELLIAVLDAAKNAGCSVSLDLGSFEVVGASLDILPDILERYVDIVFANEDEAARFSGDSDPSAGLNALGGYCDVAAVKLGRDGALLKTAAETVHVPAVTVETVLDTTGAGDFWAAGFLRGFLNGFSLSRCGYFGALLGGHVVQCMGADLPDGMWENILQEIMSMG